MEHLRKTAWNGRLCNCVFGVVMVTRYMKYLYPFECETLKLSTLAELQYAVDGNRREGRRPSYCGAGGGPNGTPGSGLPGDYSPMSHPHHSVMTPSLQPCTPPGSGTGLPPHLVMPTGTIQSTVAAAAAAALLQQQQQQQHPGLTVGGVPTTPQQFSVDGLNAAAMAAAAAAMAARVNCIGQLINSGRGQGQLTVLCSTVATLSLTTRDLILSCYEVRLN